MISVCMACHNGELYIESQIRSILKQLGDNDELVISDDGSKDKTTDIIASIGDYRIKFYKYIYSSSGLQAHERATLNFENALNHSIGDYIFLSDQDDVWCDNKIAITVGYLRKYSYVISDCFVTDKNLNIIIQSRFFKAENVHFNKYAALVLCTPYQGSCAAFRREVLDKAIPFPKGLQSHDRWIGDVAAFFFNVKVIPEKLIYYRRHDCTVSNSFGSKRPHSIIRTIRYKWIYIKGILKLKLCNK